MSVDSDTSQYIPSAEENMSEDDDALSSGASRENREQSFLSDDCSLHPKCGMDISTTSLLMRTRHIRLPYHRWAK